jgi:hypothetical protein
MARAEEHRRDREREGGQQPHGREEYSISVADDPDHETREQHNQDCSDRNSKKAATKAPRCEIEPI